MLYNGINKTLRLQGVSKLLLETDLIMENTSSEPRDILMTERTALSWVKLSVTLTTIALTVITNFRLDTSGKYSRDKVVESPSFSYGIAILFVLLSMACLGIGGLSYFQSIFNYKTYHIHTYSLEFTLGFLFLLGLLLLGINITFIVAIPL